MKTEDDLLSSKSNLTRLIGNNMKNLKSIPNFTGYSITKSGKVWSHISDKWLKSHIKNNSNHLRLCLSKDKKSCSYLVHRLVLKTYIGGCPDGMECRHLDGNPQNNNLNNLCWGTKSENAKDSVKHGTARCIKDIGEKHPCSKLTEQNVRMIIYMYKTGLFTLRGIANKYNVRHQTIHKIITKKRWKHI